MQVDPIKSAVEMVKRIRVSSVLGSIVFVLPFTLAALVVVSFTSNFVIEIFLMWLNGILFAIFAICFLNIFFWGDHAELKSEDHEYRMKALEVIGDQTHRLNADQIENGQNNPALPDPRTFTVPTPHINSIDDNDDE